MKPFHGLRNLNLYSYFIHRRRTIFRNPIPRRLVAAKPFIQLCTQALRRVMEAAIHDPGEARWLIPWMWGEHAIEAKEHAKAVGDDIANQIEAENARHTEEITRLRPIVRDLGEQERSLRVALVGSLAAFPIRPKFDVNEFGFADDEPETLEATAARLDRSPPSKLKANPKILTVLASGTALAVSFGVVIDAFGLGNIVRHVGVFLGIALLAAILMFVTCTIFETLGEWIGTLGVLRSARSVKGAATLEVGLVFLVLVSAAAVIASESLTEQSGLYAGIQDRDGLTAAHPSTGTLLAISLLIVIPTVLSSLVRGLRMGAVAVDMGRLEHGRNELRNRIRKEPDYKRAALLHQAYRTVRIEREDREAELLDHEGALRYELTEAERFRKEDPEMDAYGYSIRAEEELDRLIEERRATEVSRRPTRVPWWRALWMRIRNAFLGRTA